MLVLDAAAGRQNAAAAPSAGTPTLEDFYAGFIGGTQGLLPHDAVARNVESLIGLPLCGC